MHQASLDLMNWLLQTHTDRRARKAQRVIDVGSYNRNEGGSYREICGALKFKSYTGLDIESGPNVDAVVTAGGDWAAELAASGIAPADVVISGQCLEHVRMPWIWIRQVAGLIQPGGMFFCIAPFQWRQHRYPVDCWRLLPDGYEALCEWSGLEFIKSEIVDRDCYLVARRPAE